MTREEAVALIAITPEYIPGPCPCCWSLPMAENRDLALAAAEAAADATLALLTFAREGAALRDIGSAYWEHDPVSRLADALALTIRIEDPHATDDDLRQLLGAAQRYLEG